MLLWSVILAIVHGLLETSELAKWLTWPLSWLGTGMQLA